MNITPDQKSVSFLILSFISSRLLRVWQGCWDVFVVSLWFGRSGNWEHFAHVLRQHIAKGRCVGRQGAPLVPEDGQVLAQRFAPVGDPDDVQRIPIDTYCRGNDGYTVPTLSHCQQRMRCPALENDIGLDACQTAGGVEGAAG
jgi:hypothetical protein